jgi:hypothetical protein
MKRLLLPATILILAAACNKSNDGANSAALLGSWRYTGNNPLVGENLGDTLRFVKPDTVYYTYQGSTTWSNYRVQGNQLVLIGSAVSDTLLLRSLNASQLQLIVAQPALRDTVNYQKFAP